MANPSLQIGNSNWAIKEDNLLGYSTAGTRFVPQPITMTRASAGTRVNSSGLVETVELLGSEEITNGDFATDTDWTKGAGWTISGGTASHTGGASYLSQDALQVDTLYKVNISVTAVSGGGFVQIYMGNSPASVLISTIGDYTYYFTSQSTINLGFGLRSLGDVTIDNVSAKEATKNNLARVDYDGTASSLLVEPQRTNLIKNSEPTAQESAANGVTYEAFSWSIGFTNCVKWTDTNNSFWYGGTVSASTEYTMSVYIIMDDLSQPNVGNGSGNDFFLIAGNTTASDYLLVDFGNNIWRVSGVATSSTINLNNSGIRKLSNSSKGFRAVGFQLEAGSYATSYIPTSGSTVTRVQDQYTKTGISNLINSTEGVLFVEMSALADDLTGRSISLNDGTYTNTVILRYLDLSNQIQGVVRIGGSFKGICTHTLSDSTISIKVAYKWKDSDFALWINGSEVATSSDVGAFSTDTINKLSFDKGDDTQDFFGKVKQLQVFKTALTDTELATLTT